MGIDFKPQNALEQAIHDYNSEMVIYAIAENNMLSTLVPASNLGYECFSDEVIFAVLLNAVTEKQLHTMTNGWFWGHLRAGERLRKLVNETLAPLPQDPSDAEKKLIKAIVWRENNEIIRLIREENAKFYGFAPELLIMLPELSREAVLMLLQNGVTAKLKAMIFGIFLAETANADILKSFSYAARVMYANLMLSLMQGEDISATEAWYPEARFCRRSYCFDPEHRYEPFSITHTMLVNSARLKALNSFEPEIFLE